MDEKALAIRIGDARRKTGLTQQQLCQQSGLSYSTLAKIERGAIKSPSIFTIQQIALALNLSLDELIGNKPASISKKRSKSGIEFVYFDINGCLVRFFHRAFAAAAADTGVTSDIAEETYWQYTDAVCRGELSLEEFSAATAKKFGIKDFNWGTYYLDAIEPIDETAKLLEWASQHYKLGLMSNIMPGMISAMIDQQILPNISYDVIIDSSEVGAIKPETKIYEIAQEKSGVSGESILLIDDSRANLMAAQHMNWHVLWFDDFRPRESVDRIKTALEF